MYNFATMWLTLSVIFFMVEYATQWLEVVTLGGQVAGAFFEGFVVTLGLKLMGKIVSKEFLTCNISQALRRGSETIKALIVVAAFAWEGAMILCHVMPGYTMHSHLLHLLFLLVVYPVVAMWLELVMVNEGKKEQEHGN